MNDDSSSVTIAPTLVDGAGRVIRWPKKELDKQAVITYLANTFEPGRRYTEREVNERILVHTVELDQALLRRELYNRGFLDRHKDGSCYWVESG